MKFDILSDKTYTSSVKKKQFFYPTVEPKPLMMRDFTRNVAYHVDATAQQPLALYKHGVLKGYLFHPSQIEASSPKQKMKSLKDLDFFKKFVEPPEWKGRSSADIAQELRERASQRS
jgi:hypothetical protein